MQCRCCMQHINQAHSRCPICGFPTNSNSSAGVEKLAKSYRADRLSGITVSVKFFYYERSKSGELVEGKSEYVTIAQADTLEYRSVFWFGKRFNPPQVDRNIQLEVRLGYPERAVFKTLTAIIEDTMNCARLGLYLDDGFNVCLAAGDENNYVLSERTPLIQSTVQK